MGSVKGHIREATDLRSISLSMAVHVVLFICLALFWNSSRQYGSEEPSRRVSLVLATEKEQPEYLNQDDLLDETIRDNTQSDQTALPSDEPPPVDNSQLFTEQATIDLPLPGLDATSMTDVPNPANKSSRTIRLTPEQQKMLDAERAAFEARRPKGPATTLRVFNSGEMTGRKFVFVIDRSKSMGGQGLNVLPAAANELTAAINQLKPYHQFQIVAYHHKTVAIQKRTLLAATEENKNNVSDFIGNLAAFGGTEHEGALMVALGMDPDVVVLITDGGLPALNQGQLARIRRAADGAQIHCLQFGSGPPQSRNSFMRLLAAQNKGSFRYIDVNQWGAEN